MRNSFFIVLSHWNSRHVASLWHLILITSQLVFAFSTLYVACLETKQQIPILNSLFWLYPGSNQRSTYSKWACEPLHHWGDSPLYLEVLILTNQWHVVEYCSPVLLNLVDNQDGHALILYVLFSDFRRLVSKIILAIC